MDHDLFHGQDESTDFLVRRYADGTITISTRPLGGLRWSPEVVVHEQPAEVCS